MRRRLLALFVPLCLTVSLSVPAGVVEYTGFSDVDGSNSYVEAIQWAAEQGYVNGYPDGRFGVNDPVTRQQLVTLLWRWAGSPDAVAEDYADENTISAYAQAAVDWSRSNRILDEREDGRFAPNDSATRAEVVSALYQYRKPSSDNSSSPIQGNQDQITDAEGTAMPQVKMEVGGQTFTV